MNISDALKENTAINIKMAETPDSQTVHTFDEYPITTPVPGTQPSTSKQVATYNPGGDVYSVNQTENALVKTAEPVLPAGTPILPNDSAKLGLLVIGLGVAAILLFRKGK